MWTAAVVSTTTMRDTFISSVKKYAADGLSSQPLGDWYETTNGDVEGFRARPVVGGHFALVSNYIHDTYLHLSIDAYSWHLETPHPMSYKIHYQLQPLLRHQNLARTVQEGRAYEYSSGAKWCTP